MDRPGFEPGASRLQGGRSTIDLPALKFYFLKRFFIFMNFDFFKLCFIIYCGLILYLSVIPLTLPEVPEFDPKKLLYHFTEFFFFSFLAFKSFKNLKVVIGTGSFFAILTEILQMFVPYRYFDFYDLIANFF